MVSTWRRDSLDNDLINSIFYTKYTTVRTAIITPVLVLFVFLALRAAGTRTLTPATMFNRILSVAVGSLVGGAALRPNTTLLSAVVGVCIIVLAALVVNLSYVHGFLPAEFVHVRPTLLYANGRPLNHQLRKCLITEDTLNSQLRAKGYSSTTKVHSVVLEPAGTFSVITYEQAKDGLELLTNVDGYEPHYFAPGGPEEQSQGRSKRNGDAV